MYRVLVDDNFHYQDESERYELGPFATLDEAIVACRRMVDEDLASHLKPGMTAEELYELYTMFDRDPFIVAPDGNPPVPFSAWEYAHKRCSELAQPK